MDLSTTREHLRHQAGLNDTAEQALADFDALVAMIERLESSMENMRAHGYRQQRTRLLPYVLHRVDCTINHAPFESCTCGLSVALNATD